jgi:hypothetical protein
VFFFSFLSLLSLPFFPSPSFFLYLSTVITPEKVKRLVINEEK